MILLTEPSLFRDPMDGSIHDIMQIPEDKTLLVPMEYYVLGSHVYKYIGKIYSKKSVQNGSIYILNGEFFVKEYETDEEKERFGKSNIISKSEYERRGRWKKYSIDEIAESYLEERDTNLMKLNRNKLANTGDVYIPELNETDDPMERVIKLIVIQMKLRLNEKRGSFAEEYGIDNLRSALNGATKNMSILKFLMWCDLLKLDWEISLINAYDGVANPLPEPVTITNRNIPWEDIPMAEKKGVFNVPLVDGEDPLKRIIKIAIFKKVINLKDYRHKGTTAHLINNLCSGLKGKQKMSIMGALTWCEILDLIFILKVTNTENGVWYKSVGYDVYTNVQGDEHATYINEKGLDL